MSILMQKLTSQRRFTVVINEGAFFYEPWLNDSQTNKAYHYNKVPKQIRKAFVIELHEQGNMTPHEARMLVEFVINH